MFALSKGSIAVGAI
jgi:hypothetical protein